MEASLTALCGRAGLSSDLVAEAAQYQRTLHAKQMGLGVGGTAQSVVCLHLAASQRGHSLETKNMVRLAGAKSKPHYLGLLQNAEKILELEQVRAMLVCSRKFYDIGCRSCLSRRSVSGSPSLTSARLPGT